MVKLDNMVEESINWSAMPLYFRSSSPKSYNGCTYIKCGEVKRGGNEPYCFTEEKRCAGHICRILCPEKTMDKALVIRDDGTMWSIWLSNFKELILLEVKN